jgi:hypothetical protein
LLDCLLQVPGYKHKEENFGEEENTFACQPKLRCVVCLEIALIIVVQDKSRHVNQELHNPLSILPEEGGDFVDVWTHHKLPRYQDDLKHPEHEEHSKYKLRVEVKSTWVVLLTQSPNLGDHETLGQVEANCECLPLKIAQEVVTVFAAPHVEFVLVVQDVPVSLVKHFLTDRLVFVNASQEEEDY